MAVWNVLSITDVLLLVLGLLQSIQKVDYSALFRNRLGIVFLVFVLILNYKVLYDSWSKRHVPQLLLVALTLLLFDFFILSFLPLQIF